MKRKISLALTPILFGALIACAGPETDAGTSICMSGDAEIVMESEEYGMTYFGIMSAPVRNDSRSDLTLEFAAASAGSNVGTVEYSVSEMNSEEPLTLEGYTIPPGGEVMLNVNLIPADTTRNASLEGVSVTGKGRLFTRSIPVMSSVVVTPFRCEL